jgi:signal peptidase I
MAVHPVAGWFISLWLFVEFVKLFENSVSQHGLTVLTPFFYFPYGVQQG